MVPILLRQRLIALPPANTMFDHDPSARERLVIADVLGRTVVPARFARRGHAQASRMQLAPLPLMAAFVALGQTADILSARYEQLAYPLIPLAVTPSTI